MESFIERYYAFDYLKEAHVYDGIHVEVKKDRMDFHHKGELIHSHKGDYSTPNKRHLYTARAIASNISNHLKGSTNVYGKKTEFKLNKGVI